ncbi:hypothetical protein BH10ACI2_BH10ACI2_00300 [soil metagenome]
MKEYTTVEAAEVVGDLSADSIRKIANKTLIEDVEFKRFGRTIVITEAGIARIKDRNTKPGPKTNGGKTA